MHDSGDGAGNDSTRHEGAMDNLGRIGRVVYGIAIIAFGVLCFAYAKSVAALAPLPATTPIPLQLPLAYLFGAVLIVGGAAIAAGIRVAVAAACIAVLFAAWLVALHLPNLLTKPHNGGFWTGAFETLAMFGAALALAQRGRENRWSTVAYYCFAISFVVFGTQHFVYHDYIASVIPGWIPGASSHVARDRGVVLRRCCRAAHARSGSARRHAARCHVRHMGSDRACPARVRRTRSCAPSGPACVWRSRCAARRGSSRDVSVRV